MRLLLDTHALLWWIEGNPRLSTTEQAAIGDAANEVLVSAASAWEITTRHRIGKLCGAAVVDSRPAAFGQYQFDDDLVA